MSAVFAAKIGFLDESLEAEPSVRQRGPGAQRRFDGARVPLCRPLSSEGGLRRSRGPLGECPPLL